MGVAIYILLVVLLVTLVFGFYSTRKPKHFPPGPMWLPVVGNALLVKKLTKKLGALQFALLKLSEQYNTNVLGLKLGQQLVVTVFTYAPIEKILNSEDFNARPTNFFMKHRCLGDIKGITCSNGKLHKAQKSFLFRSFGRLGFPKTITEIHIQHEVNCMLTDISENVDIEIGKMIAPSVICVLWAVITGSNLHRKDKELNKVLGLFEKRGKTFDVTGGILAQHPWLRFIAPERTGYNLIKKVNGELQDFFRETIIEHYKTWKEGINTDIIYTFITEMKREGAHSSFTDSQLLMLCLDLFIGGATTSGAALDFAFLMMLRHPDVQEKVQRVLDDALNRDQSVTYADRRKIPYVEAVLLEVERHCSVIPLIGPRKVRKDTNLEGYVIPKNTTVLMHTHDIRMNPKHWVQPEKFIPERFLSTDGSANRPKRLLTFGIGARRCVGESLAKTFVFIVFAEILRNYTIVESSKEVKMIEKGNVMSTKYSVRFVKRNIR